MKINDIFPMIVEGISPIVFHATGIGSMIRILKTNRFVLTPSFTKSTEENDKLFFMSTARTRLAAYHRDSSAYHVLITLDGRKLSQRLSGRPVDYWGHSLRNNTNYEEEDRVFSDKPTIENFLNYVLSVDVLVFEKDMYKNENLNKETIRLYSLLKKAGISARFYRNKSDWRTGSTNTMSHEEILSLNSDYKQPPHNRDYREREMFHSYDKKTLSMVYKVLKFDDINMLNDEEKKELRKHIRNYPMDKARILSSSFTNNQKNPAARNLIYLISVEMKKRGLRDLNQVAKFIFDEWVEKQWG